MIIKNLKVLCFANQIQIFQPIAFFCTNIKTSAVPTTRLARFVEYASAASSIGARVMTRKVKNAIVGGTTSKYVLNEDDISYLVETLCRMRGAALKLGQIISIQDNEFVPDFVQSAFARACASADFMPSWQVKQQLNNTWGKKWPVKYFEMQPIAAASIGQVHWATTHNEQKLAVKIQYPGIAKAIESDLSNVAPLFKSLLPANFFPDRALSVARHELRWEIDYRREAAAIQRYANFVKNSHVCVPKVFHELSSDTVLTMEYLNGVNLNEMQAIDAYSQEERNFVAETLFRLVLRELFVYNFVQTDPNPANFVIERSHHGISINLLDFGSTRSYPDNFIADYLELIKCASELDRRGILHYSQKLGFLCGLESHRMQEAHCDSVESIGVPFASTLPYDFSKQKATSEIKNLIPVMLKLRVVPPPRESYSLHRKLAGIFLFASKLQATMDCRKIFHEVIDERNRLIKSE